MSHISPMWDHPIMDNVREYIATKFRRHQRMLLALPMMKINLRLLERYPDLFPRESPYTPCPMGRTYDWGCRHAVEDSNLVKPLVSNENIDFIVQELYYEIEYQTDFIKSLGEGLIIMEIPALPILAVDPNTFCPMLGFRYKFHYTDC